MRRPPSVAKLALKASTVAVLFSGTGVSFTSKGMALDSAKAFCQKSAKSGWRVVGGFQWAKSEEKTHSTVRSG